MKFEKMLNKIPNNFNEIRKIFSNFVNEIGNIFVFKWNKKYLKKCNFLKDIRKLSNGFPNIFNEIRLLNSVIF